MEQAQALTFPLWRLRHANLPTELALVITQPTSGLTTATLMSDGTPLIDPGTGKGPLMGPTGQVTRWTLAQLEHVRTVLLKHGWRDAEED